MAFRRRGRGPRAPRVKQNVTWATPLSIADQPVISTVSLTGPLLLDADWDALITYERVKLLRVKGWLAVGPAVSSATPGGLFMAIFKMPQAVTPPSPVLTPSYDLTDLLWAGGCQIPASAATGSTLGMPIDVDVSTHRNMDPEDQIVWVARTTPAGATCRVSGLLRALWTYK